MERIDIKSCTKSYNLDNLMSNIHDQLDDPFDEPDQPQTSHKMLKNPLFETDFEETLIAGGGNTLDGPLVESRKDWGDQVSELTQMYQSIENQQATEEEELRIKEKADDSLEDEQEKVSKEWGPMTDFIPPPTHKNKIMSWDTLMTLATNNIPDECAKLSAVLSLFNIHEGVDYSLIKGTTAVTIHKISKDRGSPEGEKSDPRGPVTYTFEELDEDALEDKNIRAEVVGILKNGVRFKKLRGKGHVLIEWGQKGINAELIDCLDWGLISSVEEGLKIILKGAKLYKALARVADLNNPIY
ncbi:phosphoprotein [Yata virus]|uniref:Phosphoprotein n=1 Tax=Yata virus TaxID=1272960 RepID=A0A096ZGT9_9RHAB|nr:phosphoprotein [Yata virus]AIR95570.1 phosphoprotein [Yata virus]